jgi:hypothetical protein
MRPMSTSPTPEPRVAFGGPEQVDIAPTVLTYEEIEARRAQTNDGTHAWCVRIIFQLQDPEIALDDMVCGPENMVGIMPIICFWCGVEYPRDGTGPAVDATYCPGRRAKGGDDGDGDGGGDGGGDGDGHSEGGGAR